MKNGISEIGIAQKEGIEYNALRNIIDKMITSGEIEPRSIETKKDRIRIAYNAGVPKTKIAIQEHITYTTLYDTINQMQQVGEIEEINREKSLAVLSSVVNQLKSQEQLSMRGVENRINDFIKERKYEEAIEFLECVKGAQYTSKNKDKSTRFLLHEQKEMLSDIQDSLKTRIKRQEAIEMLRKDEKIDKIKIETNLPQAEIINLRVRIKVKNNHEKKEEITIG